MTPTSTAPADAPEDTPSTYGSASALRTMAWIATPTTLSPAPTRTASSTRGVRTCQMIWYAVTSSAVIDPAVTAAHRKRSVSPGGTAAAPSPIASSTDTVRTAASTATTSGITKAGGDSGNVLKEIGRAHV